MRKRLLKQNPGTNNDFAYIAWGILHLLCCFGYFMIFFTSDLHLHHANIIRYCQRPFESVEEMDYVLIDNWNSVVKPEDSVWVLGDFSMSGDKVFLNRTLDRLNGTKFLVAGNHDSKPCKSSDKWREVHTLTHITEGGQILVLCHYAMRVWYKSHCGSWHLYGHSHGNLPEENNLSFDVGVDSWNYTPVSFDQIAKKMLDKKVALNPGTKGTDLLKQNQDRNRKYFGLRSG